MFSREGRLAPQQFSPPVVADELAVSHLHFAAHRHHGRPPFDLHSLEAVVVVIDVLGFGRDDAPIRGIVNNEVGIAAHGNCPFLWKKPKDLGGSRTGGVNEAVKVQGAALHAIGVQQVDTVFNAGNAVGNLGERIFAQELLFRVERAMVGADGIDQA